MSSDLFADWHEEQTGRDQTSRVGGARGDYTSPYMNVTATTVSSDDDEPLRLQPQPRLTGKQSTIFELREHGLKISRRKGFTPRCFSVGNNVMTIGSAEGSILRCTVDATDATPNAVEEISIEPKVAVVAVYIDPSGGHVLISMESGTNWYLHSSTNRPRKLTKAQGRFTAVAWDRQLGSPATTESVLIGTDVGHIYEAEFDGKEKKFNRVYAINQQGAIAGLEFEHVNQTQLYVIMTTSGSGRRPTRMYQFIGGPTFEALFGNYMSTDALRFNEIMGDINVAQLSVFSKHERERAKCFAVLTGEGVYHGDLIYTPKTSIDNIWTNVDMLSFPPSTSDKPTNPPLAIATTEFHIVLVYSKYVQIMCKLNGLIVLDEPFDIRVGNVNGIAYDPTFNTYWIHSERRIIEVIIRDEDRHIWNLYLAKAVNQMYAKSTEDLDRDFNRALGACNDMVQRQKVWTAQADAYFDREDYDRAAALYAKSSRSFEEVALRFMEVSATTALHSFLLQKLNMTSPEDKTQATVLCSWLVELYLDKFNGLSVQTSEKDIDVHANLLFEFKQFLQDHKQHLDPATTFNLISSHGRADELVFYASLIEDYEKVVTYHIHRGEYGAAIELLKGAPTQKVEELYYKYSPELIIHKPKEVFEVWKAAETLDPSRLIPSIVRHVHQKDENVNRRSVLELAIDFLKFAIKQGNRDQTIHNYVVFLLAKHPDERLLINFLSKSSSEEQLFDPAFALRLCAQHEKNRACIYIYSAMGLYQEAVEKALQVDVSIAKEMANMPEDADLKKTLWTLIAKHTIDAGGDIKEAMSILNESEMLQIEDILPFFPDFVVINDFKKEICESLQVYNDRIEQLKCEMREYTESAELIRADMQQLRKRSANIYGNQRCDLTGENILSKEFYLFPCGHAFHASALRHEMTKHLNSFQRQTVKQLMQKLQELSLEPQQSTFQRVANIFSTDKSNADAISAMKTNTNERELVQQKLDEIIASECIFCGEVMIKSIHLPFITEDDEAREGAEWQI
ncbi:vacuolar protein sorting-associated protein 18 [Thraustotheca clavata]|uniref:Vacuolar protein sorting-associated protein 18 n=1 Tax=Thraustotheca clavata TaxID=74557 RepID=A0A1V9ZE02_9STRA|nr:vacuolar protein sorting-associated protein 18 [Thraustotheca clavata]